jgi:hypothetical protein
MDQEPWGHLRWFSDLISRLSWAHISLILLDFCQNWANRGVQSCHYLFPYFVPYSRFGPENDLMVILMAHNASPAQMTDWIAKLPWMTPWLLIHSIYSNTFRVLAILFNMLLQISQNRALYCSCCNTNSDCCLILQVSMTFRTLRTPSSVA